MASTVDLMEQAWQQERLMRERDMYRGGGGPDRFVYDTNAMQMARHPGSQIKVDPNRRPLAGGGTATEQPNPLLLLENVI
jgi:hypothetical protein